jgi:hypothetical protein
VNSSICARLIVSLLCIATLGMRTSVAATSSAVSPAFTVDLQMTVTVKGRVLSAANRAPLVGVTVTLAGLQTTTDGQGTFSLPNAPLASGNQLTASKTGYAQYVAPVPAPPGAVLVTLPDILLHSGTGPIVTSLTPRYDGIFIADVPVQNTYTATVNWNGTTPGTVRFLWNGSPLQQQTGAGPDYSCLVEMSTAFRPALRANANYLEVVAASAGGTSSSPYRHPVAVIPMPPALAALLFVVDPSDDDVSVNVDFSIPEPGFSFVLDLPVIGKFGAEVAANACFDYTVSDGDWEAAFGVGAGGRQGKRGRRPTIPGLTRHPKMKLYVGNKEISGKILAGARGTATISDGIVFREVFGHGEIEAKLELGRVGLPDLLGPGLSTTLSAIPGLSDALKAVTIIIYVIPGIEGEVVCTLIPEFAFSRAELTGKVGLEAAYEPDFGFAKGRIYVGGEPSATLQIPPPLLKQLRFRAYAGAEFEAWIISVGVEYVFVDVSHPATRGGSFAHTWDGAAGSIRMFPVAGSGRWRPVSRAHLLVGPERFAAARTGADTPQRSSLSDEEANRLTAFRSMGQLPVRGAVGTRTASARPSSDTEKASNGAIALLAQEQADLTVVNNVFPSADPAMAGWNDELILLYVGDNGGSNTLQCTDIRWTRWDGADWTVPATVHTNTQAEFAPQVAVDGNGDAIAVWERVADTGLTNADLSAIASQMEIAWSRWDRATGVWATPQALTTNGVLDHVPLVCGPMGDGSLLAVWTRNDDNLLMGTNGAGSQVIWSKWNPAVRQWSAEQALLTDVPYRLSQSLAGTTNRAVYAWSSDADGVLTNAADQQIFRCEWNGSSWSSAAQVTNDDLGNKNVRVAVSPTGEVYAIWQQGTNLVMNRNFAGTLSTVRVDSQTAGFADYAMTFGPAGNVVLIWQEMTQSGSDAHYMVFDPVSDTWSRDSLLCEDPPLERSFAPVWDNVGNLTVAYNKVQIEKVAKTVELEGGGTVEIENVPQPGRVDLCVTKRALIRDLAIELGDFTADGGNFLPGDAVKLSATVRNVGNVAVTNVAMEFFDGDPAAGGSLITNTTLAGWFEGESTNVATALWVVPAPATNHALFVVVNRTSTGSEFSQTNNSQKLSIGGVDLNVSLVDYAVETDGSMRVIAQVVNEGAPTATNSLLAIRACDASGTNVAAPMLAFASVAAIAPGRLVQVALDLPAGTQPEGNAFYQLRADDAGVAGDIAPDDNTAVFAVSLWVDSDGDGIADSYESLRPFLSVTNAVDAAADHDGDGMSNLAEYLAGTDPDDHSSYLSMGPLGVSVPDGVRVIWGSASNRLYSLERSTSLIQQSFEPLADHIQATPPENVYEDSTATNPTPYFYRIRLE